MPLDGYGVARGKVTRVTRQDNDPVSPHFTLKIKSVSGQVWVIPVNVQSNDGTLVWVAVAESFGRKASQFLDSLLVLSEGFLNASDPSCPRVDYVRRPLFDRHRMVQAKASGPGANDDIQDVLFRVSEEARQSGASVFVFGEPFQDGGRGVHGVHMNQGNDAAHSGTNGTNQDGCLIFHFPNRPEGRRFVGFFFAFDTQCWFTSIRGHALPGFEFGPLAVADTSASGIKLLIESVVVNPIGDDRGRETVKIHNPTDSPVNLDGWLIQDGIGKVDRIEGGHVVPANGHIDIRLTGRGASLPNSEGRVILLRPDATVSHDAKYTVRGEGVGESVRVQ